jgi:type II secretory pathway component GspD/PulD (secretin)
VLQSEPTPVLIQGLQRLVPTAMITPDKDAKQIMVIAKPDEQKIIETNVKAIIATFTAPEEPMLFIYPATQDQRDRLEAFIKTAARDLKGVAVVPDKSPNQISVWAKPSEHQLIATILKQMEDNKANEPIRQLKVFQMSIGDMTTAQEILKISHPAATLFSDKQGNRLLVWATPEELEKVTQTLTVQGNLDSRQMLAYPVAGVKPETLVKVIQDVFQGLKITPEPQSRRILVWATPEEHVKVAEIVEQANKESEPDSELAEKFVAYSAANLDAKMITGLFKAMIPDADVYADPTAEKITVRARTREHIRIKELFEQLRERDAQFRPVLVVYPIGDTDPVMIEAMLRSQLKDAESMSSDDLIQRLGYSYYYERMPWYRSYNRQTVKKTGYFKVDPQTQSAYVFVNGDDQKEVAEAIKQIVAVGNQEGVKPVVKRYSLDEMSFYDIYELLYQVAPSARFQTIYTYTPGVQQQGWYSYATNYRDFLAYTRESEHEKIEILVREMNDRAGAGKKELLSVTLTEGSKYSREQMIETIRKLYPDISPMPGGIPNQILVWAPKHKLERVQQIVDEACQPLAEGQETVVKSYPLQYISVEDATAWLKAVCPNASFNPSQTPATPATASARQRVPRPDGTKILVVIATPLEHAEITKAISELDKDLPVTHKMVPRFYAVDDFPATVFSALYSSLSRAFPNNVFTPSAERQTIMAVAVEDDQQKIADFIKAYRDDVQRKKPSLEVYALKRQNFYRVYTLINRVAPSALIFPGSKPEQIAVWGTPKEHLDVSTALTKLETAASEIENQNLKIYKVGAKKATTARQLLTYQFPGALIFEISQDEIIAWAGAADHESIAKMLETVAEAFPESVLKTYYFKNVPLGEGYTILNQMYYGRAALTVRASTGDLLVHAPPEIQAKVAASIAEFDIPRPAETEAMPVAYDLSDIPVTAITYAATSIRQALGTQVIVLPSSVPGQLIVWGKLADQQKVKAMVDQMLLERPETTSKMQTYTIYRGTARSVEPILLRIVPNARFGYGINPNQLLAWAKEADHVKIKDAVDKLNETDPDVKIEAYSLKNIYMTTARTLLTSVISDQGLDVKTYYDYYGNQLIVQAKPEAQKTIRDLLEKLRTEDRELAVFTLEVLDPITVDTAINALFLDEPYNTTPGVGIDQNANIIFVQGTKAQLDKTRKMLIEMGEPLKPVYEPSPSDPGAASPNTPTTSAALPNSATHSQIRVIQLKGDASATIRELEKLWPQYQQNRLRVIRQDEPLIQKKDEEPPKPTSWNQPAGFFSMNDPAEQALTEQVVTEKEELVTEKEKPSTKKLTEPLTKKIAEPLTEPLTEQPAKKIFETPGLEALRNQVAEKVQEAAPNVYVIVNEDGSLTVTSHDDGALDQLERLIKRIDDRVVFEGRDYTIYSVRNISALVVSMKLQLILRERLAGRQQRFSTTLESRFQPPRLEITADESTNTIYVRGAKAERTEVANLIAMLDVSELPGERAVRKPFKVPIKNTQAFRVVRQILNVYQQKMMSIRLPGGVYPRVAVDNVTNSVEIIAPEPLATELKEYAEEIDRMTVEEPARKIHVISLKVKSTVIQNAIQKIQQSSANGLYPYAAPMPAQPMPYYPR